MEKKTANRNRYNRRNLLLKADGHRCCNCDKSEEDTVLDIVFVGTDEENAFFEDFLTVCRRCHRRNFPSQWDEKDFAVFKEQRADNLDRVGIKYEDVKEEFEREGKVRGKRRFF